jgi:L,D-transpeptidase ErfK/SrfK
MRSRPFTVLSVLLLTCLFTASQALAQNTPTLSNQLIGREFTYTVKPGDSLTSVGARFGVAAAVLAGSNGLSPNAALRIAQVLHVDNRHIVPEAIDDGIVINIPQRMLFLLKRGQLLRAYAVALGKKDWTTVSGLFKIVSKQENPTWEVPASIQEEMRREGKPVKSCEPPGPDNPLGKYWLGLNVQGYGIHGTIAPSSIYQFQTHGCIRLHPDDIAQLFNDVERGTPVLLLYRRLLLARVGARILLEVNSDIYNQEPAVEQQLRHLADTEKLTDRIDWQRAEDIIQRHEGIARDITMGK